MHNAYLPSKKRMNTQVKQIHICLALWNEYFYSPLRFNFLVKEFVKHSKQSDHVISSYSCILLAYVTRNKINCKMYALTLCGMVFCNAVGERGACGPLLPLTLIPH